MDAGEQARAVALALPGVEERQTWGKATFRVAGRLFLTLAPDGTSATMKASLDAQAALIAEDPTVFSVAAYLGRHGWITVALDRCDPDEAAELVVDAWRQRAPAGSPSDKGASPVRDIAGGSTSGRLAGPARGPGRGM